MNPNADTSISPDRARRAQRHAILAQCFGVPLYFALTAGGLATLYAEHFGAGDFMNGVVNGSVYVGCVMALLMPDLVERYNKRKVLVVATGVGALLAIPLSFLPNLRPLLSDQAVLVIMAMSLFAYSCCHGGYNGAWYPAISDFVPFRETGKFFARLRMAWMLTSLGVYIMCFLLIQSRPDAPLMWFQIIIAALTAAVFLRAFIVSRFPQRAVCSLGLRGPIARVSLMLKDRRFRRFLLLAAAATAVTKFTFPSMIKYMRHLEFGGTGVMVALVVRMAAAAVSFFFWGHLVDRHGPRRAYRIGFVLAGAACLLWVAASYAMRQAASPSLCYGILLGAWLLHGAADAGVDIAITRHGFQVTPAERAPTYLAIQPSTVTVVAGLGMILVGAALGLAKASESTGWLNPYVIGLVLNAIVAVIVYRLVRHAPAEGRRT